jgi:peptidoglycan hydrolase CwlO-like protein
MNIKKFLLDNAKNIFYLITWGFLIYAIMFRDNNKDDKAYKEKILKIDKDISEVEKYQKQINNQIIQFNTQIGELQSKIDDLEGEKTIIKEIYYEKINNVSSYTDKQLDSFFTERYRYNTN